MGNVLRLIFNRPKKDEEKKKKPPKKTKGDGNGKKDVVSVKKGVDTINEHKGRRQDVMKQLFND